MTNSRRRAQAVLAAASILLAAIESPALSAQQPAGPPPTPPHTGIKATIKQLGTDITKLPSVENLLWVGIGSGAALEVHPFDDDINRSLTTSGTAERLFKPGAILATVFIRR